MKKIICLLATISLMACNESSRQAAGITSEADSADKELQTIMADYTSLYHQPYILDTSYVYNNDTIRIILKHYSLMDSALTIPNKYTSMYGLDSFVTHNFAGSIRINKNNVTAIDRMIYKHDFAAVLDEPLMQYGTLLYPNLHQTDSIIVVNYSASIPLTDVGKGVSLLVKDLKSVWFVENK